MKLQITAGALLKALTIVNRARVARSVLPILDGVLMQIEDQKLVLSRTILNLSIRTTIAVDYKSRGDVVAPANSLTQLVSKLPQDEEIVIESSEKQLAITSKHGKYEFATMLVDEFPRIRSHESDGEFRLNPERFATNVKRVAFCVSTDISRPALNGVYWNTATGKTIMAATDSHALSWNQCDDAGGRTPIQGVIVPVDAMTIIAEIAKNSEEFFVAFKDVQVSFRADDTEVVSNLINGPYPDIDQVIPRDADKVAVADRQSMIEAIERLDIIADDFTHRLKFSLDQNTLSLSGSCSDARKIGMEVLECEFSGEQIEIAFNLRYVLNSLNHIDTQKVRIEMTTPQAATIFRPINVSEYFYLVMPLRPD